LTNTGLAGILLFKHGLRHLVPKGIILRSRAGLGRSLHRAVSREAFSVAGRLANTYMAITKQKKATILASATEAVSGAAAAVFVTFNALTVKEVNELRAALRTEGVKFTVVKKTLLQKALEAAGTTGDMPEMPGEIALATLPKAKGDDVTAPARSVQAFVKKFKDKLTLAGGVINGAYLSKDETRSVAVIPPMPALRGMFANVINSPIQRFAIALGQVAGTKA
jgi:large subunit ribosomal protein L10